MGVNTGGVTVVCRVSGAAGGERHTLGRLYVKKLRYLSSPPKFFFLKLDFQRFCTD